MKCSCIDIGSNTVKISVFERRGKHWNNIGFLGEQTGLISYVTVVEDKRVLSEEGKTALLDVLGRLVQYSLNMNAEHIFTFATASLRGVSNADEIKKSVYDNFGLTLEILSGDEEAICSLKGLLLDEKCEGIKSGIMIDMGGGSTEIVYFENGKTPEIVSLDFGCLSLTDGYFGSFPPKIDEIVSVREYVKSKISQCSFVRNLAVPVFLIGGTARAAVKMANELLPRQKEIYKPSDFLTISENMSSNEDVRDLAMKLIPKRLHTITAGCAAYFEILNFIKPTEVHLSESGVREGYLERILL